MRLTLRKIIAYLSGGQYDGDGTTWKIKNLYANANIHNSSVASAIKAYSY